MAPQRLQPAISERREIVDPQPFAVGSIRETYERYPHIGNQLPSMGYSEQQIMDLEATINRADCDLVVFSTPADLSCLLRINKPALRIRYEYKDHGPPFLKDVLAAEARKNRDSIGGALGPRGGL